MLLSKFGEGRGGGKLRCVVGERREGTLSSLPACLPSSFEGSYGSGERGIHHHHYHHGV